MLSNPVTKLSDGRIQIEVVTGIEVSGGSIRTQTKKLILPEGTEVKDGSYHGQQEIVVTARLG